MRISTVFSARGFFALAVGLAGAAAPVAAQQTQTSQQTQKEHVVKQGDTLWDLARFYFNDPYRWPLIYDANKNVVNNPHWIYPAEKLIIPGMTPDTITLLGTPVAVTPPVEPAPLTGSNRSRFYSGPVDTVQAPTLILTERDRLKLVQPHEWLGAPWIADSASLGVRASVYKPADPRDQDDLLPQQFHPYDRLFVTTLGAAFNKGDQLLAVRLHHHRSLLGWGVIVEPMAVLRVDSIGPNTALTTVINQFGDLRTGDIAIALPAIPRMPSDEMTPVSGGPTGTILEFLIEQPLYSTTDIAFVTLGGSQGITIGDELLAYVPSHKLSAKHPEVLPDQPVATMRVLRVTDKTATVRVVGLRNTGLARGLPVRVARKAP